jgi:endonuclease/exonuclease/phosphatase family metal-dependent hydrolase
MRHRIPAWLGIALVLPACVDTPDRTLFAPDAAALASHDAAAAAGAPVRLMSRNLYLGANIDQVLFGGAEGVAAALAEIQHTSYPHRAHALAAEIAALQPHLVGLQEVSTFVLPTAAGPFRIDFLAMLLGALEDRGLDYEVAIARQNFATLLPIAPGVNVFYADGDAILARPDVVVHTADGTHFAEANQVDLDQYIPGLGYNLRGYQWADVSVAGQRFLFINTHLEVQFWADVQERQAAELLAFVEAQDGPIFMTGDFNSAANPDAPAGSATATYPMILDAGFDDLWLRGHGAFATGGLTCCQASDLSNEAPALNQRIDFLFARNVPSPNGGFAGSAALDVIGDEAGDRFGTPMGYDLWPSDHAGLFGELRLPPGLTQRRY